MRPAMPKPCSMGSWTPCSAPTRRRPSVSSDLPAVRPEPVEGRMLAPQLMVRQAHHAHRERLGLPPPLRRTRGELAARVTSIMFRSFLLGLFAGGFLALTALALRPGAIAAAGPSVTDEGVTNRFPDGIEFRVSASGDRPIERGSLRYTILPDGTTARAVPDFEPGTRVSTTLPLAGGEADVYLPPGTRIRYHWEVEDADGNTASTPEAAIVYEDVRFEWRTVDADGLSIHYYSGSDEDAQAMLDVARDAI